MGFIRGIIGKFFTPKAVRVLENKALIRSVIGNEYSVVKKFENLAGIQSSREIFKRFPNNYVAILGKSRTGISAGEKYTHHISVQYDAQNKVKNFGIFDVYHKDVSIYDSNGYMLKHYSPEETAALARYKCDSKNFHKLLRYNTHVKNEQTVRDDINIISNLFKFNYKVNRAKNDFIVYRALDKKALKTILSMQQDGMVYVEPSILSVATKKKSILQFLRFGNFNHILRLKVPKNTKYINLDEVSANHIIYPQFPENELIFKPGTKILVKNRSARGGYIDAEIIE